MTSENASMNRDDVHAKQSPVQRKMLNPNSFRHPDSGRIWTMVEYWTIQPLALRRRLLANQHRTNHADVHRDRAAPLCPSEREILHGRKLQWKRSGETEKESGSLKTTLSSAD
jgi:hypothetical protein